VLDDPARLEELRECYPDKQPLRLLPHSSPTRRPHPTTLKHPPKPSLAQPLLALAQPPSPVQAPARLAKRALVDAQSGSRQSRQDVDARIVRIVKSERAVPEHKKAKTETRARAKRRGHSRKTSGPSMAELLAHSAKKKAKR